MKKKAAKKMTFKALKKIKTPKNLWTYLTLLFAGLWVGTLFFNFNSDFWHNTQTGISALVFSEEVTAETAIEGNTELPVVFENNGRTYVAYDHPLIKVVAITTEDCEGKICNLAQAVQEIKENVSPGLISQEIKYETEEGKTLVEKYKITTLPAFIFDTNVEELPHFKTLKLFLEKRGENYFLIVREPGKTLKINDQ